MAYETLLYEVDDRVATITLNRPERHNTLNRPERHNALSQKLCAEIMEAVHAADQDPDVRVLVITGAGGKAFSAGYDIKESAEAPKRSLTQWRERLNRDLRFTLSVWECSKPVIAMIDGFCLAGALEFAQMCDLRVASESSQFAVIETRFSNGIATYIMPWIIGARCRRLIYTGDMIDAQEAHRLGLVDLVYPKTTLRQETMKLAKRMSRVALEALQWNKRAINNTLETMGFRAAMQYGVEACSLLDASNTPEYAHFDELRRTKGLGEAMKWRDAQFAPFE